MARERFLQDVRDYIASFANPANREAIQGTDILSTLHLVAAELRADPERPAEIDPNYLADPQDQAVAIAALKMLRQIVRQAPLAALIAQETRPGPDVTRDDDLLNLYRQGGQSGYHACGTCRMGGEADSVLDPQLRVRGVERLRVMDLSVAPTMISGNTNGPVMAMAWHAADLILATTHA